MDTQEILMIGMILLQVAGMVLQFTKSIKRCKSSCCGGRDNVDFVFKDTESNEKKDIP